MITVLYSIDKNQSIDGNPSVTMYFDNNKFVTDMNSFASFMKNSKGFLFVEKKNNSQKRFGRFQAMLKKLLE
jgi:hypothetical protein